MRTETTTRTLYKFNELSERAQDNAIECLYDLNVSHGWWESVYEDAERVGLKITEFDLDRGNSIKIDLTTDLESALSAVLREFGEHCDAYTLALETTRKLDASGDSWMAYETLKAEFLSGMGEKYLATLRHEFEYLTSREAIVESILANDYEFDETGKLA